MSNVTVHTNHAPRQLVSGYDVPDELFAEGGSFDYMDETARMEGYFVKYRGWWYAIGDFMVVGAGTELSKLGWQGVSTDSMFSATIIKIIDAEQTVIMGRAYW